MKKELTIKCAELYKAGKSAKEIAKEIGLAPSTVGYHLRKARVYSSMKQVTEVENFESSIMELAAKFEAVMMENDKLKSEKEQLESKIKSLQKAAKRILY